MVSTEIINNKINSLLHITSSEKIQFISVKNTDFYQQKNKFYLDKAYLSTLHLCNAFYILS